MNVFHRVAILGICFLPATGAVAAGDLAIERLATCQDSWLDWQTSHSAQLGQFIGRFRTDFIQKGDDGFFVPRSSQTVLGLPVTQVSPQSIGMAVGFSVLVTADFDTTKAVLERKIGRTLKCEPPGVDTRGCELALGENKTVLLAAFGSQRNQTLLGCYYLYEK